jgi:hypothetical protein
MWAVFQTCSMEYVESNWFHGHSQDRRPACKPGRSGMPEKTRIRTEYIRNMSVYMSPTTLSGDIVERVKSRTHINTR